MTAPTAEAFLSQPSTDEDDFEHESPLDLQKTILKHIAAGGNGGTVLPVGPLESIASSLQKLVALTEARDTDVHGEELRELGQAYDDLEAKHRSLYDLLAEVEKLVKPSTSKLANSVRDAINAWRNPTVEQDEAITAEPDSVGEPYTDAEVAALRDQPAADAGIEEWRAYGQSRGVAGAESMNRSQIRTALGLPHFDPEA